MRKRILKIITSTYKGVLDEAKRAARLESARRFLPGELVALNLPGKQHGKETLVTLRKGLANEVLSHLVRKVQAKPMSVMLLLGNRLLKPLGRVRKVETA